MAFEFDRYINGTLMAESVIIERQKNLADAMREAARIASRGPNGEAPVLVLRAEAAERALAERAGGGGKQDAIDFLYKHGALTHVAAREAVELLTSNGFEISRRSK